MPDTPWDGVERRQTPRHEDFSADLRAESRRQAARLLPICMFAAMCVAAAIGGVVAWQVPKIVKDQSHKGLLYNCKQQEIGRIQGRSRAFAQQEFLKSHVAIRQISAKADAAVAATLKAQFAQYRGQITPGQRRAGQAYVDSFEQLADVSRAAADFWQHKLLPLIDQLPNPDCDRVFAKDEPPELVVPKAPQLPRPPAILRPRG